MIYPPPQSYSSLSIVFICLFQVEDRDQPRQPGIIHTSSKRIEIIYKNAYFKLVFFDNEDLQAEVLGYSFEAFNAYTDSLQPERVLGLQM